MWNLTLPAVLAKRVSSCPLPTFNPGWILEPLWRMMMVPAFTRAPAGAFTPRRLPALSLPFLELELLFLCAMNCLSA